MAITLTKTCIYCPPNIAEPRIVRGNTTISAAKLKEIHDYFKQKAEYANATTSILIGAAVNGLMFAFAPGVPIKDILGTKAQEFMNTLISGAVSSAVGLAVFELLNNDGDTSIAGELLTKLAQGTYVNIDVSYEYTYNQHGSNDGAYYLTKCQLTRVY